MFLPKSRVSKAQAKILLAVVLIALLILGGCQGFIDGFSEGDSKTFETKPDARNIGEIPSGTDTELVTSESDGKNTATNTSFAPEIEAPTIEESKSNTSKTPSRKTLSKNPANTQVITGQNTSEQNNSNTSNSNLSADLGVHFIDVGQGDAIFIELANGQTMLIDAGERNSGDQVVSYIKLLGYNKIDYVIATHPHSDHIGGMTTVINKLNIGKFYMPDIEHTTKTFESMIDALISNDVDVYRAAAGVDILKDNGLHARFLSPASSYGSNLNNWSAVVKLDFGQNSFLFMGDAESQVENSLSNVKADVLKVGHHGSDTSCGSTFLNKVAPKISVISVGNNSYGHPTQSTINKLTSIGCQVYRTDLSGTIIVTSD
ncbi:MAG: MBL fold metallo-hydrolase [Eubacteriales bacterium]|nr:MBL fold metallo-hydrolase [Eubacteriales bacterium]